MAPVPASSAAGSTASWDSSADIPPSPYPRWAVKAASIRATPTPAMALRTGASRSAARDARPRQLDDLAEPREAGAAEAADRPQGVGIDAPVLAQQAVAEVERDDLAEQQRVGLAALPEGPVVEQPALERDRRLRHPRRPHMLARRRGDAGDVELVDLAGVVAGGGVHPLEEVLG